MKQELLAGRFEPIRRLGQGGMAEVVLARDTVLGEETALKIIHPHLARDPALRQRFKIEVQVSRAVRHPGIIEVKELFENADDGRLFISMEYLPGGDLKRRIACEGALPAKEVERIAVECLEALSAAHAKGIVHRDLKPQNILFDAQGSARIADFGMARVAAGAFVPDSAMAVGTPDYCPPEIMRGEGSDGRSDLYSLGVTLFEAATGRLPFAANSPYRSMKLRATVDAPRASSFRPEIPARLDEAIARSMERESGKRFQTARSFLEAVRPAEGPQAAPSDSGVAQRQIDSCFCPDCGAAVPRSLSWCFSCGRPLLRLKSASGRDSHRVVVTGPGKPGDKLDPDQRAVCLRLASYPGVDSSKLGKRIPRLPFTLFRGLTPASARELVDALGRSGIEAVCLGSESRAEDRKLALSSGLKRVAALTPRVWLILLATTTGFWNNLRIFSKFPPAAIAAIAAWILVPPAALALANVRAFARIFRRNEAGGEPPLRDAAESLELPELRRLARLIAEKRDALEEGMRACAAAESGDRDELEAGLDEAARAAAGALLRAQELSDQIGESSGGGAERELQRELDVTKDRILGCGAAFDSLSIRLSGLSIAEGKRALAELELDLRGDADMDSGLSESGEAAR